MTLFNIHSSAGSKYMSIAVLLSGLGTNFEALYRRQSEFYEKNIKSAKIDLVFSNVPGCLGTVKAEKYGIKTVYFSSKQFFESIEKLVDDENSRELYDLEVIKLIENEINPDLLVLAGYRRKLSGLFYKRFKNTIINMYPGDTTKDYLIQGVPASVQAIRNNDSEIRCTVYIDRENQRFGPVIAQSEPILLERYNENNVAELDDEIRRKAEWTTLPFVVFDLISHGRISIDDNDNVYLDNSLLPKTGYRL